MSKPADNPEEVAIEVVKTPAVAYQRPRGVVWRIFSLAALAFILPVQVKSLPYPELFTQAGIVLTFLAIVAAFVR